MKKTWSIFYGLLLATFLKSTLALPTHIESAAKEERSHLSKDGCPNYRYKCPDCPHGTQCVYPNSGGCDGAGIPVCQSLNCHGIVCLLRSLPCPEECPFSCTYDGPGCCPFIGEPVCKPRCETFAPCKETPCPDDCHDDCFYPDADYCCPRSGQPVCRNRGRRLDSFAALPDKKDILSASSSNVQISPSSSVPAASPSDYIPSQVPKVDKRQAEEPSPVLSYARLDESRWFDQPIGPQMPESASWFLQDVPGKVVSTLGTPTRSAPPELYLPNATPTPYGSNWFYQPSGPLVPPSPSSWLYQPTPKEGCPPCPPLPTPTWGICTVHHDDRECCPYITCVDVPLSVNRPSDATASHAAASNADAALDPTEHVNVCANHNNPCSKKCPDSCNHPKNVPCPLQHQPASPPLMPVVVTVTVTASRIKHTPTPTAALPTKKHIPALDRPLESVSKILSSLRHVQLPTGASRPDVNNAVLPTGVARHQAVGHNPEPVACPKIIYKCPPECPDYCIRPRGPCPYAVVPVCPDGEDEDEPRYMDDADLYIDSLEPHPIHKNP